MPGLTLPRSGQLNLAAILASQHPTIDLHLAQFNSLATAELNQRREAHTTELKRLNGRAQNIEKETNQCKVKEIELIEVLEHEREETKEVESAVAALRPHVAVQREASAALDADIEQYRARVAILRNERELERKTLDAQRAHVPEELRIFERALGCVIEGVGPDQLLIRYVLKDAQGSRSTHEASFVLDVSSPSYKVVTSTPLLPTLRTLLDQLNETLDIYTFIKHMREAYVKLFS
ncbi:hypothetical protein BGW80DRAFT_1294882 [Lactifluus volemus]|nr:hypothetical protein BGW80DRAFT_1294882 [Lactifluus volemus]